MVPTTRLEVKVEAWQRGSVERMAQDSDWWNRSLRRCKSRGAGWFRSSLLDV